MDRRQFLKVTGAGVSAAGLASCGSLGVSAANTASSRRLIAVEADATRAALNVFSWDTEGGEKSATNLLRSPVFVRVTLGDSTYSTLNMSAARTTSDGKIGFVVTIAPECDLVWTIAQHPASLAMNLSATGSSVGSIQAVELVFPWDPGVTPTTLLPKGWTRDGKAMMPIVLSAPDFGQIVVSSSVAEGKGRLEGSRAQKIADLVLELPALAEYQSYQLTFTRCTCLPRMDFRM